MESTRRNSGREGPSLAFGTDKFLQDMRIVINALSVYSGGGLVSLLELLPALRELDNSNEYIIMMGKGHHKITGTLPEGVRTHVVSVKSRSVLIRILFEQLVLPFILWRIGADWLYSPGNQTVLLAPCRVLVLMENSNPYSRHPIAWNMRERTRLYLLRVLARLSCWRATKVRFLTENSCRILSARLGIPKRKACIIPQGVKVHESSSENSAVGDSMPDHYVFTVSNVAPHKNIHCLMKGFDIFVQRSGYKGSLVIAGEVLYKGYFDTLMKLQNTLLSGERIEFLRWVDPKRLGFLYSRADMFVFPSIEETFGMPVIEAMAYGVPVLASRVDDDCAECFIPFEEICGEAAVYFDPFDPEDLSAQMQRVCADPQLRESLVVSGKARASEFSWLATAALLSREFSSN